MLIIWLCLIAKLNSLIEFTETRCALFSGVMMPLVFRQWQCKELKQKFGFFWIMQKGYKHEGFFLATALH